MMIRQELKKVRVERLLQHRAHAQGSCGLLRIRIPRHDDHRNAGVLRIAQLSLTELPSIHLRHHEIDDDEARTKAGVERVERLLPVVCEADVEPGLSQKEPDGLAALDLVVDDEDGMRVIGHQDELSAATLGRPVPSGTIAAWYVRA